MPDADAIAAREKRVLGVFVLMLGIGLILDLGCVWCGGALIAAGMGLLAWGMVQAATRSLPANATASTASDSRP